MTDRELYREALSDISALAEGYDGFESPEDLRSLIDDMANVAMKARNQEPWTTRIKQN